MRNSDRGGWTKVGGWGEGWNKEAKDKKSMRIIISSLFIHHERVRGLRDQTGVRTVLGRGASSTRGALSPREALVPLSPPTGRYPDRRRAPMGRGVNKCCLFFLKMKTEKKSNMKIKNWITFRCNISSGHPRQKNINK